MGFRFSLSGFIVRSCWGIFSEVNEFYGNKFLHRLLFALIFIVVPAARLLIPPAKAETDTKFCDY